MDEFDFTPFSERQGHDWLGDAASASAIVGSFLNLLPKLAAVVALLWYCILIWESRTSLSWRARWRRLYRRVHKEEGPPGGE